MQKTAEQKATKPIPDHTINKREIKEEQQAEELQVVVR